MLHNIRSLTNRSVPLHLSSHAESLQAIWHFFSESLARAIQQKYQIEIPEEHGMLCSGAEFCFESSAQIFTFLPSAERVSELYIAL